MTLSSAAQRVPVHKQGPKCGFGEVLRGLSAEDLAFFKQMVADGATKAHIARVFRDLRPLPLVRRARGGAEPVHAA